MFLPPFTWGLLDIHILYDMYIYIYIFGYFKHEFPWIFGLTGFSRPPFCLEETHIQNLNMAEELFHGFKNKKGHILCILHCISHKYMSLCSRASFIWTTRLKHCFCCFHGLPYGITGSDSSFVLRVHVQGGPLRIQEKIELLRAEVQVFCLANLEEFKTVTNSPFFSVCVVWLKSKQKGNNQNHHYLY